MFVNDGAVAVTSSPSVTASAMPYTMNWVAIVVIKALILPTVVNMPFTAPTTTPTRMPKSKARFVGAP